MKEVIFVTGNENKYKEFQNQIPELAIVKQKIDLDEIQAVDVEEVCEHKVKQAFEKVNKPVIVEDTGLYLDELEGLPGAFSKFFETRLGGDFPSKLLRDRENKNCVVKTCIGFYDGENLLLSLGECEGTIVEEPRGEAGFGFDVSFLPKGCDKTTAEMSFEEKMKISFRRKAIDKFREDIKSLL